MRILLFFLIVNAFALQIVSAGFLSRLFNVKHRVHKESNDKYPAHESDVQFWCTNTIQETAEIKLNDAKLKKKLTTDRPINFVIHGFMANRKSGWINSTVRDWVKYHRCNVCAVDWSALAGKINYITVATKYTKQVANVIHRFMEFLIKERVMIAEAVSIAGHSLGAHIAGLVGASFGGKIYSIYGLDPAGPGFTYADDNDVKLDKSDARYVQCIYTDGNVFGTDTKYGNCHANFYCNGGDSQPGCLKSVSDLLTCDHSRACDYFQESLEPNFEFWGIRCPLNPAWKHKLNFQDFMHDTDMDRIGVKSAETNGTFCVDTNSEFPFAMSRFSFLQKINHFIENNGKSQQSSSFWKFLWSSIASLD